MEGKPSAMTTTTYTNGMSKIAHVRLMNTSFMLVLEEGLIFEIMRDTKPTPTANMKLIKGHSQESGLANVINPIRA